MKRNIQSVVQELLQPYLDEHGFELVDIEYVKERNNYYLRVYVDKPGGIDIDDCGRISEFLSKKLDEADPISNAYFLEVSSPGAERPLKKPADYERAIGRHVFIKTYEPIDGLKEFEGTLLSYNGDEVIVQLTKQNHTIPMEKIAAARLAILI